MNSSSCDNNEELMLAFQHGDEGAFDTLYERHHRSVLNTAYRLLSNRDTAEDITQEIFAKLYSAPGSYRPVAMFTTWLYRITCNACIDEMRKQRRRPSQITDYALVSVSDAGSSPEATAEANETVRAVQSAIASLPKKQRIAVILQR
ncbi:MAG: sigma-70 family RNA polymerase sigma factor, partial [bacterium]|nr:sigma-70 family RNA polymerase sigma factor [bacterium]